MNTAYFWLDSLVAQSSINLDTDIFRTLEDSVALAKQKLQGFANTPEFSKKMALAFGKVAKFDALQKSWTEGDFKAFPEIEIRSAADINGAKGAFAAATNKIYLSQEFLNANLGDVGAISQVLLEEYGHYVDGQINLIDSEGDEGQIFSELVSDRTITPEQLQLMKNEDDTALINLDGKTLQIEQAAANQTLLSQRVGTSLGGNFSFGNLLGIPNEKRFNIKDVFGAGLVKNDVLGLDTSFRPSFSEGAGIDLGAVGASVNVSALVASSKDKSKPATLKAGLKLDAGYNLGGLKWGIPLLTNASLGISNSKLNFEVNRDLSSQPFIDLTFPYLFLNLAGVIEANAAAYINGKFDVKYVNLIKSLLSFKKEENTKSFGFDKKIDLSTKFKYDFIKFDTRKTIQEVNYISGKETFEIGNSNPPSIKLNDFFDLGFELPDFSKVDFKLINSDPNSYTYQVKDNFKLLDFTFDVDGFIGPKLPIPITLKGGDEFDVFGKTFGYSYDLALFDLNINATLDVNYEINLGIKNLNPKIQIEDGNGTWRDFNPSELNFPVDSFGSLVNTDAAKSLIALDKNGNNKIDFLQTFNPDFFLDVNSYIQPSLGLTTGKGSQKKDGIGIGAYDFNLKPFKRFSGALATIGVPRVNLPKLDLFKINKNINLKDTAASLGFDPNLLNPQTFSLDIAPINSALGVEVYNGTEGADYYPGKDNRSSGTSELILFKGGPDVGQLSPGRDNIDFGGGGNPLNFKSTIYYGVFKDPLVSYTTGEDDLFILDSDLYLQGSSLSEITPFQPSSGADFEFLIDPFQVIDAPPTVTDITNLESILFSDELQASTRGISLSLSDLSLSSKRSSTYIGGLRPDVYATKLPLGNLTGTQGPDTLGVPIGYNRAAPYVLGAGDDKVFLVPSLTNEGNSVETVDWVNPYDGKSGIKNTLFEEDYEDIIDLGGGSNQVNFSNAPGPYSAYVTSVDVGNTLTITGDLGQTTNNLRFVNLGGSTNLNFTANNGKTYGILSGGGNSISVSGNESIPELTFLLESQGFQKKFNLPDLKELEVELKDSQLIYRTPNPDGTNTPLQLTDNLDPDTPISYLILASADLAGETANKEIGSDKLYSLQGPSKQTYIIGKTTAVKSLELGSLDNEILVRGRLASQKDAYRKVVLKDDMNSRTTLGDSKDLFDEIVFEGRKPFDTPLLVNLEVSKINKVDFTKVDFTGVTDFERKFAGLFGGSYMYEVNYSERADIVSVLPNIRPTVPSLKGSFQDSPFATYAPLRTHLLGGGDDVIVGLGRLYEFFYPGAGNNTVINPIPSPFFELEAYEPSTSIDGSTANIVSVSSTNNSFTGPTGPIFGDVVVYTEGIRSDYVIQRSQTKQDAIEVTKKDGSKDTLLGVSLIKFETEDVSLIPVSDSITAPVDTNRVDIFGNDLKSRLFYSTAIRPDGQSFEIQLGDDWAVDRVDVTQNVIYQPGVAPAMWNYDLPIGLTEFDINKKFLLTQFSDADITAKGLYTLDDLTISDLKVTQGGNAIDIQILNDTWRISNKEAVTLESFPFEISYIIKEPEGYSHYVRLALNPSQIINLEDLRTVFQASIFTDEYNGSSQDDNILGSEIAETIRGNAGLNIIYGGDGDDKIFGGNDSEFISGDTGSDVIEGGGGDDLIDGDGALSDGVAVALGQEITTNLASADDIIDGGEGNDIMLGGIGDDRFIFGKGDDLIDGGEGIDTGVSVNKEENFRLRKRLDGSVVVLDRRTGIENEGLDLYLNTERFEFSDRTLTVEELPSTEGTAITNADKTQVNLVNTAQGNIELNSTEGGKILALDIPSLEDLIIDQVILGKSLATLEKYRSTQGEKFDVKSLVLEFSVQTSEAAPKEVIEIKLETEQAANSFVKVNPNTGEVFQFNYNPETGLGAELIDTNANGLVDLIKIHVKDGSAGDADGTINGVIYDPGLLANTVGEPSWGLDFDGDGSISALSDGIMAVRYMFGSAFSGNALIDGAISPNATRNLSEIQTYLQEGITEGYLDIDGDGTVGALSDGIMAVRYMFGAAFSGNALIDGAISPNATRDLAGIQSYLAGLTSPM